MNAFEEAYVKSLLEREERELAEAAEQAARNRKENSMNVSPDLQQKVLERIKSQIGDLLTQEDIKMLTEKALEDAFFKPIVTKDGWSEHTKPPLIVTMVGEILAKSTGTVVDAWFIQNEGKFKQYVEEAMGKGVVECVKLYFEERVTNIAREVMGQMKTGD